MRKNVLICGVMFLIAGATLQAATDKEQHELHPQRDAAAAEIKGKLLTIDSYGKSITIQDEANQHIEVSLMKDTRIMDASNKAMKWEALRPGDKVIVYYNTQDRTAIQIDLQSGAGDILLGTTPGERR